MDARCMGFDGFLEAWYYIRSREFRYNNRQACAFYGGMLIDSSCLLELAKAVSFEEKWKRGKSYSFRWIGGREI